MHYPDGREIELGDLVWWNEGSCVGRIAAIFESADELSHWGLDEYGIFICNDVTENWGSCDIFYPRIAFESEGIAKLTPPEIDYVWQVRDELLKTHPEILTYESFGLRRFCDQNGDARWKLFPIERSQGNDLPNMDVGAPGGPPGGGGSTQ